MQLNLPALLKTCLLLLVMAATANATTLGPLGSDPNAYNDGLNPTWQGMVSFTGPSNFSSEVDYAVYAPGMFGTSAALFGANLNPANDPSAGHDFVYAFEVFNTGPVGDAKIVTVSIGLDYHNYPTAIPVGSPLPTVVANTLELGLSPVSSKWNAPTFSLPANPAQNSVFQYTTAFVSGTHSFLIYVSPFGPHMSAGVSMTTSPNGLLTPQQALVPAPTPEPATLVLGAIAGVCLLAVKFARRRRV